MPAVLVTGAGRGIGRAITEHLSGRDWTVYAGARSTEALDELAVLPGVAPVRLDVSDPDHVAALDRVLPDRLDGVVNNAGIFVNGPLEAIDPDALARQLDVNVVAQVRVTQAVLPRIRAASGRIVFMSSTSGLHTTPGTGAYNASKYALEAVGDALRVELRPWRIPVALIEPGPITTGVWGDAQSTYDQLVSTFTPEHQRLYADHIRGTRKLLGTIGRATSDARIVARAVEHALIARRPKVRYLLDASSRAQKALLRGAPPSLTDRLLHRLTTST